MEIDDASGNPKNVKIELEFGIVEVDLVEVNYKLNKLKQEN